VSATASGGPARTALLSLLQQALDADAALDAVLPITGAVERALGSLLSEGADGVANGLRDDARDRVQAGQGGQGGKARARLAAARWPPMPPALDARDLSLERRP